MPRRENWPFKGPAAQSAKAATCWACGGTGWVPWQGRWQSLDPQDWDSCDKCGGLGEIE
jgi:DnaJ-class molecular chaperone